MSDPHQFDAAAGRAMMRFQFLEEALKDYAWEIAKQKNPQARRKRLQRWPALFKCFKANCPDKRIVAAVKKTEDWRVRVTHKLYVDLSDDLSASLLIDWAGDVRRLQWLESKVFAIYQDVYRELQIVRRELLPSARPQEPLFLRYPQPQALTPSVHVPH